MKKIILLSILLFISITVFSQKTIQGIVVDENKTPLSGVSVTVKGSLNGDITDLDGKFRINNVTDDAILVISFLGYNTKEVSVKGVIEVTIELSNISRALVAIQTASSVSMRNYWLGAKIGYNFIGNTDDNFFVGSASIVLNLLDKGTNNGHYFGVVGNIGNFKFDKDNDSSEDIKKLAQSINGLSVGLGYTREWEGKISYRRFFARTGVRLTTFDEVGNNSDETINLAQSVTNLGFEYELTGFKNEGTLSLSTGLSFFLFDKRVYNQIFDETKGSLVALDVTAILPVSKTMGFFINGTFARKTSAAYIIGIIFRPDSNDNN